MNTIANYDPAIIEHLDIEAPAVLLRDSDGTFKALAAAAQGPFLWG